MCARCFIAKLHIQLYITFVYSNVIENSVYYKDKFLFVFILQFIRRLYRLRNFYRIGGYI